MIKRGQVFVRALNKEGKWDSVDIFDLDDESFRVLIVDGFVEVGLLVALKGEISEVEEIILREKSEAG